jgi:hypothetical protein
MAKKKKQQTPFLFQDREPLTPLININEKPSKKQKRPPLSSFFDEDMEFILDTYQEGLKDMTTPAAENRARGALLKNICKKKAPHRVAILDQLDKIGADIKQERITLADGLEKIERITLQFGAPKLSMGVQNKINRLRGTAQHSVRQWLSFLQAPSQPAPSRPPLINLTPPKQNKKQVNHIAQFVAPSSERKQHPMAAFLQQQKKQKRRRR